MEDKTRENTPYFGFEKNTFLPCKIVHVYDGDTCTGILEKHANFYKFKIRLYGINAPEIRPLKSLPHRDAVIQEGKRIRDRLSDLVLNKMIHLVFIRLGRHQGRFRQKRRHTPLTMYYKKNSRYWTI